MSNYTHLKPLFLASSATELQFGRNDRIAHANIYKGFILVEKRP